MPKKKGGQKSRQPALSERQRAPEDDEQSRQTSSAVHPRSGEQRRHPESAHPPKPEDVGQRREQQPGQYQQSQHVAQQKTSQPRRSFEPQGEQPRQVHVAHTTGAVGGARPHDSRPYSHKYEDDQKLRSDRQSFPEVTQQSQQTPYAMQPHSTRPRQKPQGQSQQLQPPVSHLQVGQPQRPIAHQHEQPKPELQRTRVADQMQLPSGGGARPRDTPQPLVSSTVTSLAQDFSRLTAKDSHDFPSPQVGTLGRKIALKANHFKVDLPKGSIYHYDVDILEIKTSSKNGNSSKANNGKKPTGGSGKLPVALRREIIQLVCKKYDKVIGSNWPAYDGNKNMYTRNRLAIGAIAQFRVTKLENFGKEQKEVLYQVAIKPVEKDGTDDCEISLEPLHEIFSGRVATYPQEAVHALNIILRYGPSLKYVPVGYSFFMKPSSNEVCLEEGRAIWFGYHQSLRPGWKTLPKGVQTTFYLNINKSATAFLRPMNLIDFSVEVLHLGNIPNSLNDDQIKTLSHKLKNIQIKASHLPYPRKYRINRVLLKNAKLSTFEKDNRTITVEEHFRDEYGKVLRYPMYPCVHVGNPARNINLPMEYCEVVDCQPSQGELTANQAAAMIPYTAIPPEKRFKEIGQFVHMTRDNNVNTLKSFDIDVSTQPIQLQGRILDPPQVEYNNSVLAKVKEGQWEMQGKSFINALTLNKWIIISLCPTLKSQIEIFVHKLKESGRNLGMTIDFPCTGPGEFFRTRPGDVGSILSNYKEKNPELQMIVVILPKNSVLYKEVKHEGETNVGLITQCVTDENIRKCIRDNFSFRFLMNICQKINAKLGGTNVSLQKRDKPHIFSKPIIIIGADVTHPPAGSQEAYSIAACVASMDSYPARYVTKVRVQKVNQEIRAREERILELEIMIKDLLKTFYKTTNKKPEQIIYFRDGVSEGQFLQVRDFEIVQIRRACTSIEDGYEPKISFIVVQKRHHTRFAPQNFRDGLERYNGNVPAGTTVDTEITHPSYFNFFLASHVALQGTSRPAHYTVLWDDNDFTADTLQKFCFYLCHTYNRCTRSISIPPPVMYADLAAYRAKLYIDDMQKKLLENDPVSGENGKSKLEDVIRTIETTDAVKNQMYFV